MIVILYGKDTSKSRTIDNVNQLEFINGNKEIVINKGVLNLEFFKTDNYCNINVQDLNSKWEKLKNWLNEYVQFQEKLKITNSKFCGNYITGNIIDVNDVLKKMDDLEKGEKDE